MKTLNPQEVAENLYWYYDEEGSKGFMEGVRYTLDNEEQFALFKNEVRKWLVLIDKREYEFKFVNK